MDVCLTLEKGDGASQCRTHGVPTLVLELLATLEQLVLGCALLFLVADEHVVEASLIFFFVHYICKRIFELVAIVDIVVYTFRRAWNVVGSGVIILVRLITLKCCVDCQLFLGALSRFLFLN